MRAVLTPFWDSMQKSDRGTRIEAFGKILQTVSTFFLHTFAPGTRSKTRAKPKGTRNFARKSFVFLHECFRSVKGKCFYFVGFWCNSIMLGPKHFDFAQDERQSILQILGELMNLRTMQQAPPHDKRRMLQIELLFPLC